MKKTEKYLLEHIKAFNERYNVGDTCRIKLDDGSIKIVTIQSPATILVGHSAVGWFKEISGCYNLDRVEL